MPETKRRRKLRILIVEDNPVSGRSISASMSAFHWMSDMAKSGEEAVRKAFSAHYDVILMDLELPDINGIEATRKIREHEAASGDKRQIIIAFTAHINKHSAMKCLDAGMDAYAPKGISAEALKGIIVRCASWAD